MIFSAGDLNIAARALATAVTGIFTLFFLKDLLSRFHEQSYPPAVIPRAGFRGLFSGQASFNTFYHQYETPQDMVLPQAYGREVATESLIGKVTVLYNQKDPTFLRALHTHQGHNDRYGYPMFVLRHPITESIWSKPAYILAALLEEMRKPEGNRLQWLLWVDADTVLMNPKIPLDVFLPPQEYAHIHLLVTADPRSINNGVFIIRVHPWSIQFVSAIVSFPTYRPDVPLEYRDQSAFAELLNETPFRKNHVIVPQRWFNAYQRELNDDQQRSFQINRGDLLVHFAGVPHRDKTMRAFIDRAERHLPEWELDYENTTYPREIREFWTEQHEKLAERRNGAAEADEVAETLLRKTEWQLARYREKMKSGDPDKVERAIEPLKEVLFNREDDEDAVRAATTKLQEATAPLHALVEAGIKTSCKRAYAVIVASKDILAGIDETKHKETVAEIKAKMAVLEETLVKKADEAEEIEKATEELEQVNRPYFLTLAGTGED